MKIQGTVHAQCMFMHGHRMTSFPHVIKLMTTLCIFNFEYFETDKHIQKHVNWLTYRKHNAKWMGKYIIFTDFEGVVEF